MTPFRQVILPGDVGSDVLAVKRALREMGVKGSGALALSKRAGPAFGSVVAYVQRVHGLKSDGVYGPQTHAIIAPHFDAYGALLYRSAAIRSHVPPPANLAAQDAAKRLLDHADHGRFRDDRGTCMRQVLAASVGQAVWSPMGRYVHLDRRPMDAILTLIETHNMKVGVFAICSDHGYDSPRGHAGGYAWDISSVNGVSVVTNSASAYQATLAAAKTLHALTGALTPWQLICGGYGGHLDSTIEAQTIPSAAFYGPTTMQEHTNHLHYGVAP